MNQHSTTPPPANPDQLLTVRDAAIYLTISERTLRRELARGRLRATRIGNALRVRRSALDNYIEANTGASDAR